MLLQRPLADFGDLGVVDLDLVDCMRRRGCKAHRKREDTSRHLPPVAQVAECYAKSRRLPAPPVA